MAHETLTLPDSADAALEIVREASKKQPVLVFKKSPICPTSSWAENELNAWLRSRPDDQPLSFALIDVIAARSLARGLTQELDITHESPQALLFVDGELHWSASHERLNQETFRQQVDRREA